MKKIFSLLSLIVMISIVTMTYKDSSARSKKIPFTLGSLSHVNWGPEKGGLGLFLNFDMAQMTYSKNMQGPGGMSCSGKFSIKDQIVYLKQSEDGGETNGSVTCKNAKCTLVYDSNSLYRIHKLVCGSDSYWDQSTKTPKGKKRYVGKIPVITMGHEKATLKFAMKMRLGPSTKYGVNQCTFMGRGDNQKSAVLRKGHQVTILARTTKKSRVGKYRGYWYYIDFMGIANSDEAYCDKYNVWMFGPFVKWKQ